MSESEPVKGSWHSALGYKFLSSDDMEAGQEINLTIAGVTKEQAYDVQSNQTQNLIAVSFLKTDKLLALNATNAKAIASIAGSPMVEKWKGVRVCIHRIEGKFFGKMQGALRIKESQKPVQQKQKPTTRETKQ